MSELKTLQLGIAKMKCGIKEKKLNDISLLNIITTIYA